MYTNVHISIIYNSQKVKTTKFPSVDKWIKKMWYIHTMEYCPVLKRNETLICATTWINDNNIMLSKKDHILSDSIGVKCPEWANLKGQKVD